MQRERDNTPLNEASTEQLNSWIKYWDEYKAAAASAALIGLATMAGAYEVGSNFDSEQVKIGAVVMLFGGTFVSLLSYFSWSNFRQQARTIANEASSRGLSVNKGLFTRSIENKEAH